MALTVSTLDSVPLYCEVERSEIIEINDGIGFRQYVMLQTYRRDKTTWLTRGPPQAGRIMGRTCQTRRLTAAHKRLGGHKLGSSDGSESMSPSTSDAARGEAGRYDPAEHGWASEASPLGLPVHGIQVIVYAHMCSVCTHLWRVRVWRFRLAESTRWMSACCTSCSHHKCNRTNRAPMWLTQLCRIYNILCYIILDYIIL
jgi:hypothetical protein